MMNSLFENTNTKNSVSGNTWNTDMMTYCCEEVSFPDNWI
jgi:hypothetical protein